MGRVVNKTLTLSGQAFTVVPIVTRPCRITTPYSSSFPPTNILFGSAGVDTQVFPHIRQISKLPTLQKSGEAINFLTYNFPIITKLYFFSLLSNSAISALISSNFITLPLFPPVPQSGQTSLPGKCLTLHPLQLVPINRYLILVVLQYSAGFIYFLLFGKTNIPKTTLPKSAPLLPSKIPYRIPAE